MAFSDTSESIRPLTGGARAQEVVNRLRAQRDEMLRELSQLSDQDCAQPAVWSNTDRNVNFLLRAFAFHESDHLQHVQRLLHARGRNPSQAQLLLARAQALRGELEALLLGLSDEELEAAGPDEGDWSARQIAEHLLQVETRYLDTARQAVAGNVSPPS